MPLNRLHTSVRERDRQAIGRKTFTRRGNSCDKMKRGGLQLRQGWHGDENERGEKRTRNTLSPVCLPTRKSSLTDSNARPSLRFFIFDDFLAPLVRDRSIFASPSERHWGYMKVLENYLASPSIDNYTSMTIEITAQAEIRINPRIPYLTISLES